MFVIASKVGMLACDVEERLTRRELLEWSVFFKMEHEAHDKARKEAESKMQNAQSTRRTGRRR